MAGKHTSDRVARSFERPGEGLDYYDGVAVGADAIGRAATAPPTQDRVDELLAGLESDDYMEYVSAFVRRGRELVGPGHRFADITTVLCAASELLQPTSYLEIGVRRGRSMRVVSGIAPDCAIIGIDLWISDYAGMENPGPEHVSEALRAAGHTGPLELRTGNSHKAVPQLYAEQPELSFDLITVDGDHSRRGAAKDLRAVLPRLRIGGVLVFDDVRHPAHPELHDVWEETVAADRRYATWRYDDTGYGVALAVRRW